MKNESKEFSRIVKAINDWKRANDSRVLFIAGFATYNQENIIEGNESKLFAFGDKKCLEIQLEAIRDELMKDKNNIFVNW